MLERYGDETFESPGTKEEILKAVELLRETMKQIEDEGGEISAELQTAYQNLQGVMAAYSNWETLYTVTGEIVRILYSQTMEQALTDAGADQETIDGIAKGENSSNITKALTYLLFYDDFQTESGDKVISFSTVGKQMQHFATFIGNASSYMRPHNNEIILSWLKSQDSNYDDYAKENETQIKGYTRLYLKAPGGVDITGTVTDEDGNVVATFRNGQMLTRTDSWIGITTCDTGNWLCLPLDKTYKVGLKVSESAEVDLKATKYDIDDNKEVRTETKDDKYDWTGLKIDPSDDVT